MLPGQLHRVACYAVYGGSVVTCCLGNCTVLLVGRCREGVLSHAAWATAGCCLLCGVGRECCHMLPGQLQGVACWAV